MEILPILLLFISLNTFAQSYPEQIAKHHKSYKQDLIKESSSSLKENGRKIIISMMPIF